MGDTPISSVYTVTVRSYPRLPLAVRYGPDGAQTNAATTECDNELTPPPPPGPPPQHGMYHQRSVSSENMYGHSQRKLELGHQTSKSLQNFTKRSSNRPQGPVFKRYRKIHTKDTEYYDDDSSSRSLSGDPR